MRDLNHVGATINYAGLAVLAKAPPDTFLFYPESRLVPLRRYRNKLPNLDQAYSEREQLSHDTLRLSAGNPDRSSKRLRKFATP